VIASIQPSSVRRQAKTSACTPFELITASSSSRSKGAVEMDCHMKLPNSNPVKTIPTGLLGAMDSVWLYVLRHGAAVARSLRCAGPRGAPARTIGL
jgi:hypothetical protein